jgi:2-iminoacetate synthase ThiH
VNILLNDVNTCGTLVLRLFKLSNIVFSAVLTAIQAQSLVDQELCTEVQLNLGFNDQR